MVDITNGVAGLVPKVSGADIIYWVMIALIMIMAAGIGGYFIFWYMKKKKYGQYIIRILDKDSNGKSYEWGDRGGVFLNKATGFKLLFLEKAKVGLNPNKIPYISRVDAKGKVIKIVTVRRIGVNNYVFVDIDIGEEVEYTVGEEDLNNAHQEMTKIRRSYSKENWLSKLAPYLMFIITIIIVMIILISLFNKFTVMETIAKNLAITAETQSRTADIMLNLTKSNVMNQGLPIIVPGG